MNWLVFHTASGHSFFSGVALITLACFLSTRRESTLAQRALPVSFLVGLIAVVLSSTPVPYWYYGVLAAATLAWLSSVFIERPRKWARTVAAVAWIIAAAVEIPYHFVPQLHPVNSRSVTIIGDSLSAGMGESGIETWPRVLARQHNLEVQDLSRMGETVASALKRAAAPNRLADRDPGDRRQRSARRDIIPAVRGGPGCSSGLRQCTGTTGRHV